MITPKYCKRRLLVFAKAPIPGQVKTRLHPVLSPLACAKFHEQLTLTTLQMVCNSRLAPVELWCAPDQAHPFFRRCRSTLPLTLHTQQGKNLGKRMHDALRKTLNNCESAVIVGTDCPDIDIPYLEAAFHALESGNDVVLGPASDGGYVLIGAKQADPILFEDILWGTDLVLSQTHAILHRLSWSYSELKPLSDIDRPEDLSAYVLSLDLIHRALGDSQGTENP